MPPSPDAAALSSTDPILQPYQLRHLTLRNRLMTSSHEPSYSEDGMPKDRYRLYHLERAKGGVALTMTAGSAIVAEDSPPAFGNLHAYKDEIVPWLRRLADECHDAGAAVMIQLTHLGRRTNWDKADWLPVLAASPVREPAHRAWPKTAEDWDLERIIAQYADAAARMQAAGLDGIELEAYGHLMDGFWSPATNHRDDQWGGSLDNRLRFTFRVLDAIRTQVGPSFIVGLRMVADEQWDKGLSKAEGLEIARRLSATGQVDFLNIIRGHIETDAGLRGVIPIHGDRSAPHLDFAGEVRADQAGRVAVFHASRITDVATARHAIESGKLDMVAMTRAHMAEPHIGLKIAQGREHDIRPCVGASYCIDRIYGAGEALCIHNAATGREGIIPHVLRRTQDAPRRAVVVGAGPGGLEAARVLGERGHTVTVLEALDQPGGQVRLLSRSARRREMIGIIDWRMAQCEKLGIEFRFDTFAAASDVLAEDPDLVILATGGMPWTGFLDGRGEDLAVTGWDILSGDTPVAEEVLVFDDTANHPGLQAAEAAARAGARVELVTPERWFAADMGGLNHAAYQQVFQEHGVQITIARRLVAVERAGNRLKAILGSDYADVTEERIVDQVIVEAGTLPLEDLYHDLRPGSVNGGAVDHKALIAGHPQALRPNPAGTYQLFRIGDAVASRNIHAAIYDALRLGMVL